MRSRFRVGFLLTAALQAFQQIVNRSRLIPRREDCHTPKKGDAYKDVALEKRWLFVTALNNLGQAASSGPREVLIRILVNVNILNALGCEAELSVARADHVGLP